MAQNIDVILTDKSSDGNNLIPLIDKLDKIDNVKYKDGATTPSDNQFLKYESEPDKWVNSDIDYSLIKNKLIPTDEIKDEVEGETYSESSSKYVVSSKGIFNKLKEYETIDNLKDKGNSTLPIYIDEEGVAHPVNSSDEYSTSSTQYPAINIVSKYTEGLTEGKGSSTKPVYFITDGDNKGKVAEIKYTINDNVPSDLTTYYKLVTQNINGENKNYPLIFTNTDKDSINDNTIEAVKFNKNIYINPSSNSITATNFLGNASTATKATKDSDGNIISTTYEKISQVSGKGAPEEGETYGYPVYFDTTGKAIKIETLNDKIQVPSIDLEESKTSGFDTLKIANIQFVNEKIKDELKITQALVFKGEVNLTKTPKLPSTGETVNAGWTYVVAEAGTYAEEIKCEIGDLLISKITGTITEPKNSWIAIQRNIDGVVIGPDTSTAEHIATYKDNTGKIIKDSGYTIETSVPSNAVFTDTHYRSWNILTNSSDSTEIKPTTENGSIYLNHIEIDYDSSGAEKTRLKTSSLEFGTANDFLYLKNEGTNNLIIGVPKVENDGEVLTTLSDDKKTITYSHKKYYDDPGELGNNTSYEVPINTEFLIPHIVYNEYGHINKDQSSDVTLKITLGSKAISLDDIKEIDINKDTLVNDQVLKYKSDTELWINEDIHTNKIGRNSTITETLDVNKDYYINRDNKVYTFNNIRSINDIKVNNESIKDYYSWSAAKNTITINNSIYSDDKFKSAYEIFYGKKINQNLSINKEILIPNEDDSTPVKTFDKTSEKFDYLQLVNILQDSDKGILFNVSEDNTYILIDETIYNNIKNYISFIEIYDSSNNMIGEWDEDNKVLYNEGKTYSTTDNIYIGLKNTSYTYNKNNQKLTVVDDLGNGYGDNNLLLRIRFRGMKLNLDYKEYIESIDIIYDGTSSITVPVLHFDDYGHIDRNSYKTYNITPSVIIKKWS